MLTLDPDRRGCRLIKDLPTSETCTQKIITPNRFTWESEVLEFHSKYSKTSCKLECKMKAASEKVDRLNQTIFTPHLRWVAFLGTCLKSLENVSVGWSLYSVEFIWSFFAASQKLESSGKSWKGRNAPFAFRIARISPTTAPSAQLRLCKRACCPMISITLKKEPKFFHHRPCDSRNLNLDPLCTLDNDGSMPNLWKTQVLKTLDSKGEM